MGQVVSCLHEESLPPFMRHAPMKNRMKASYRGSQRCCYSQTLCDAFDATLVHSLISMDLQAAATDYRNESCPRYLRRKVLDICRFSCRNLVLIGSNTKVKSHWLQMETIAQTSNFCNVPANCV